MLESSLLRTAYFGQNWDNVVAAGRIPVLIEPNFFHRSSLFHRWGLSLEACTFWTIRTCLNPYRVVSISFLFKMIQLSQKFACVRFSNFTHLISNIIPEENPLRMGLNNFFDLRTCSREGCPGRFRVLVVVPANFSHSLSCSPDSQLSKLVWHFSVG